MSKIGYKYNPKACETCEEIFTPNNSSHVHCSDTCLHRSLRGKYLARNYGITIEQYEELYNSQYGRCAICNQEGPRLNHYANHTLMVDHCHETKIVRGLLCANCNRGLGLFGDRKEWLSRAIQYLDNNANINPDFMSWRERKSLTKRADSGIL